MSPPLKKIKQLLSNPEDHVGYLLRNLMLALRQSSEAAFREAGMPLSTTHMGTLLMMYTDPGLPGAQLAKKMFITAQSMNDVLKSLEESGMVERQAHPDNQRAHRWYITDAGLDALLISGEYSNAVFERMQSQLSIAEKAQLKDLLKRCIAGLNSSD